MNENRKRCYGNKNVFLLPYQLFIFFVMVALLPYFNFFFDFMSYGAIFLKKFKKIDFLSDGVIRWVF